MTALACDDKDGSFKGGSTSDALAKAMKLVKDCRFPASDDQRNRTILAHLAENYAFRSELDERNKFVAEHNIVLPEREKHVSLPDCQKSDLGCENLSKTVEDICDLNKIYPNEFATSITIGSGP